MPENQSKDTSQAAMNLDEQIVTRLVAKIAEFDEIIMQFASFKLGIYSELMDMRQQVDTLEEQFFIIKSKFDQSSFPSLLDEFITYKRAQQKKPTKKPTKKSVKKSVKNRQVKKGSRRKKS